jgi:hypothetical protein
MLHGEPLTYLFRFVNALPHIANTVSSIFYSENFNQARTAVSVCPPVFFHPFHQTARLKFGVKQPNPVNPFHSLLPSSLLSYPTQEKNFPNKYNVESSRFLFLPPAVKTCYHL